MKAIGGKVHSSPSIVFEATRLERERETERERERERDLHSSKKTPQNRPIFLKKNILPRKMKLIAGKVDASSLGDHWAEVRQMCQKRCIYIERDPQKRPPKETY